MNISRLMLGCVALLTSAAMSSACCPELREVLQREGVDAMPEAGAVRNYSFKTEECFDSTKEVLFAVLWKPGKQNAQVQINGLDMAQFPEQNCDLIAEAVEALGDAVGGAIDSAIGDLGCALNLMPGPEFSHDDQIVIQELRKDGFEWQVFQLKDKVLTGDNVLSFNVADSSQNCTDDKRTASRLGYVLVSDVDKGCDNKFRQ